MSTAPESVIAARAEAAGAVGRRADGFLMIAAARSASRGVGHLIATAAIFAVPFSFLPIVSGRVTLLVVMIAGLGLYLQDACTRWIGVGASSVFFATYVASWDLTAYPTWLHAVGFLGGGFMVWLAAGLSVLDGICDGIAAGYSAKRPEPLPKPIVDYRVRMPRSYPPGQYRRAVRRYPETY